jgi:hypothetical protein
MFVLWSLAYLNKFFSVRRALAGKANAEFPASQELLYLFQNGD